MTGTAGFDPRAVPESNATGYPEPYRAANQQRWNRRLGAYAGLGNFGVNLTRPGATPPPWAAVSPLSA